MPPRSDMERALNRERIRLGVVLAVLSGLLFYLGSALYQVQIKEHSEHTDRLDRNSIRRVRLPATRGRVLDRNGTPLAESAPSYSLGIFVEELRQPGPWSNTIAAVDALVDDLSAAIGHPRDITRQNIQAHIRNRRPLALSAFAGLTDAEIARFAECSARFPGVDILVSPIRVYPNGDCASHIIGYVGRRHPSPDEDDSEEEPFDYYLPDLVGKDGIERASDAILAGTPGGELVRIDAIGYKHATSSSRAPVDGTDVRLSIDLPLQRHAETLLGNCRGAIAIVSVRTGEIVALASSPRYDLSLFYPILRPDDWSRLNNDPGHPLYNRATQGHYPPGSTLKPFVALAALNAGVTPSHVINCTGAFQLTKDSVLRCGHRIGHGPIDLGTAIEQSCNVYFCQTGVNLGYEPLLHDALAAIGLGERPDIEIPASPGLLPTSEWKRAQGRGRWTRGDTANLSIGQGFLVVTPLQMALATAAIANGGDLLRPRLVLEPVQVNALPAVVRHIPWKSASLKAVRDGMRRVIEAPKGGGRRAHVNGLELAGKTGTAEYTASDGIRKHTWMIAYGPFQKPDFALAVVIEDGESGGKTAAPIARELFAFLYGLDSSSDIDDNDSEYHELPEPVEPEPEDLESLEPLEPLEPPASQEVQP